MYNVVAVEDQQTKSKAPYDAQFFDGHQLGSLSSARVVTRIVTRLLHPTSVVDFGCGRGAWLRAFGENGVVDLLGIDGEYVDKSQILIEPGQFRAADLSNPVHLDRRYDLAICLEVAEHLRSKRASQLIRSLTLAAPAVLFSAAIPGQHGTHHVNLQWPAYWKNLFREHGYQRLDPVRRHITHDDRVEWWYRQNIYLFASGDLIAGSDVLQQEQKYADSNPMELIHSDLLGRYTSVRGLLSELVSACWRAGKRVFGQ